MLVVFYPEFPDVSLQERFQIFLLRHIKRNYSFILILKISTGKQYSWVPGVTKITKTSRNVQSVGQTGKYTMISTKWTKWNDHQMEI